MSRRTVVTAGVVLSRRPYGEYDLLATLYTEELGKLSARFAGVRRPAGKLKALAEPMVHGEYRLYLRPGAEWATATGGRIVDSHPGLRRDLRRTWQGLRLCELLERLVPPRAPNRLKFCLIAESLPALEGAGSRWLTAAFACRLLELAGFGLSRSGPDGIPPALWAALHALPLDELAALPDDGPSRRRAEAFVERALERLIERPLGTTIFLESMKRDNLMNTARGGSPLPSEGASR